jgi:hypothetical protein
MIKAIRQYIKDSIKFVDSSLVENQSAFYDGDIGESLIDRSYQITINNMVKIVRTDYTERSMAIQVSIFGFGRRDEVKNYDSLLNRAICIEDAIMDLKRFTGIATIVNIESNGIDSTRIPSNDDALQIIIN